MFRREVGRWSRNGEGGLEKWKGKGELVCGGGMWKERGVRVWRDSGNMEGETAWTIEAGTNVYWEDVIVVLGIGNGKTEVGADMWSGECYIWLTYISKSL